MDDDDVEMDMTPMIDVAFQLLIFFLLTINFKLAEGNLAAHLPKKGGPSKSKNPLDKLNQLQIELSYDEGNDSTALTIDGEPVGSWPDGKEMEGQRTKIGSKAWNSYSSIDESNPSDEKPPVKIKAAPDVPAGRVITVVDIVKQYVVEKEKQESGENVKLSFTGSSLKKLQQATQ